MCQSAQAPLRKRLHAVPKDVAAVVRELRGDALPAGTLDLASPLVVSQLLFSAAPEGLALDPPPGAHRNRNGHISTAGAVGDLALRGQTSSCKHLILAAGAGMQVHAPLSTECMILAC